MAKKKTRTKRTTKSARAAILAEMNSKGVTAKQVAKKYGMSVWTIYGWRKAKPGTAKAARRGRKPGRPTTGSTATPGLTTTALREEIRAALPRILHEEIASVLVGLVGKRGTARRRRGGKK